MNFVRLWRQKEIKHGLRFLQNHIRRTAGENCGYDGVNLLNASGESAGQSVPHFHIHIIPRKKGDGIDAWPAFSGARRNLKEVYEELRMPGDTVESG